MNETKRTHVIFFAGIAYLDKKPAAKHSDSKEGRVPEPGGDLSRLIATVALANYTQADSLVLVSGGTQTYSDGEKILKAELTARILIGKYGLCEKNVHAIQSATHTVGNVQAFFDYYEAHRAELGEIVLYLLTIGWHLPRFVLQIAAEWTKRKTGKSLTVPEELINKIFLPILQELRERWSGRNFQKVAKRFLRELEPWAAPLPFKVRPVDSLWILDHPKTFFPFHTQSRREVMIRFAEQLRRRPYIKKLAEREPKGILQILNGSYNPEGWAKHEQERHAIMKEMTGQKGTRG